jgi:PilZ domain-containing protein
MSNSSGRGPRRVERRALVRRRFEWEVDCQLQSDGNPERRPAQVRDISADGLGLVLECPFEPGAILDVELTSRDGSLSYTVVARVTHTHQLSDGSWLAGCGFVGKLNDEELRDLL